MKVLLVDPWGTKNTKNYLNGLVSGLVNNVDLTLMTNFYYEETCETTYDLKKVFFKRSENLGDSWIRKIVRGIEYLVGYIKVFRELKKTKYDVLHINWLLNYKQDIHFLKKIKKRFSVKIVYTAHNVLPHIEGSKKTNELRSIYKIVDAIIVHGNANKKEFVTLFPESADKVYVQKHGCNLHPNTAFDLSRIEPNLIEAIESFDRVYIFFGLIFYNKGVDRIIDYWLKKDPNALLVVAGKKCSDCSTFDEQESLANEHKNILIFDKYINDSLLSFLITKSDLVLLPYRHASMSGVVFTAADFCKPVLTTAVGSIPEYLEDNIDSFVVRNDDDSLFKGIDKSFEVSKQTLEAMGKKLNANISLKCNWGIIGHYIVENIYSK